MDFDTDYSCDAEFTKLLSRRDDIDLPMAALELARDAYPDINFHETLRWIAETGDHFASSLAPAAPDRDVLSRLADGIAGQQGITGDTETYHDPDNSYLHQVIARKQGIPISLSLLYMAVARHAGFLLEGVSAPGHFLTRFESLDGPLFLDAFANGSILTYDECIERLRGTTGLPTAACEASLEPATARQTITRMLNNLKAIHSKANNWRAAWYVQSRLVLLKPGAYDERRDLGLIALRADRPGQAINMLENCLTSCPPDETEPLTAQLEEAKRQLSRWN